MNLRSIIRELLAEQAQAKNTLSSFQIKGSPDDPDEVGEANGLTIAQEKDQVDISLLNGGTDLRQSSERKRVDALKAKIMSDEGYIARLIIDANNNVVEGQHRLDALRELGFDKAPVVRLFGVSDFVDDENALQAVLAANEVHHSDHRNRLIEMLCKILYEEKGNVSELRDYEAPRGFEKGWNAAVEEIVRQKGVTV